MNIGRIETISEGGDVQTLHGEPRARADLNGSDLVVEVEGYFSRFAVLPFGTRLPLAVWAVGTHLFEVFDSFAYLALTSPTPRCGKSRVLELLSLLCANSERTSNISEAALFRLIEKFKPTLLLDEMEQIREKGERAQILRNLLNAGNRRDATAIRCSEGGASIERCSVFCPKAIAAIGSLPDTITDRAIVIGMQRRTREEKIERFLFHRAEPEVRQIRGRVATWARANAETIKHAYLAAPDLGFLEDRDAESWAPLFSILAVADESRLSELRGYAETLCGAKQMDSAEEHLAIRLICESASALREGEKNIASAELLTRLKDIPDAPWGEEGFDQRRLAKQLRSFGLRPKPVRIGNSTPRGYEADCIRESGRRYRPGISETSATENENKSLQMNAVADVADVSPLSGDTNGHSC
jgi:hypothetical protein